MEALGRGERRVCAFTAELGLAQSKLRCHLKVLCPSAVALQQEVNPQHCFQGLLAKPL
ncbi:MAG: hypothetical protein VKL23_02930 [Cyanobacteriota bacterium]|nr:hypothetical protein [Cyanobacteriota bacterium]